MGTSTYRFQEWTGLPAVGNNLSSLAEMLTDPALGGLQPGRCVVLHNATDMPATYRILRQHANVATDTLMVYFSGHGVPGPHHNELYLTLADTQRDDLPVSALPFELIRRVFLESRAVNRVLILDCCFSGRASMPHLSGSEDTVLGQLDVEGTYTLASAPANATALAPTGATYTAFTGELLTLVRAGISGGPELLSYATIYQHLLRTLTARGLPPPQQLNSGTADRLALTRNAAHGYDEGEKGERPSRFRRPVGIDLPPLAATPVTAIRTHVDKAFAFSPDGRSLAVATGRNTVRVFDTATWRQRFAVRQHWLGQASVFAVAFRPTLNELATGGSVLHGGQVGGRIRIWNADTGKRRWLKLDLLAGVRAAAFNPDGGRLVTGDRAGTVQIWNANIGKLLIRVTHHDSVEGVAFSPDGCRLATGSSDQTAQIWDAYTGERANVLAHRASVRGVAFSPDGRLLATASIPARIWDGHTGTELLTVTPVDAALGRFCHDVAFSPDSRFLATAHMDRTARIWDLGTSTEVLKLTHEHEVNAVAFSPDGRWLATCDRPGGGFFLSAGTIHLWQLGET